jgi:CRISPR system Cascade subunit CasE
MSDSDLKPVFSRITLRRHAPEVTPMINELLPDDRGRAMNVTHRLLWTLMPEAMRVRTAEDATGKAAFLWREAEPRGRFYMLGPQPLPGNAFFEVESKPYALALRPGDRMNFDLVVHATVDRKVGVGPEGRALRQRCDIVLDMIHQREASARADGGATIRAALRWPAAEAALADWLKAQGEAYGFAPTRVELVSYRTQPLARTKAKRGGRRYEIGVGHLRGALTVCEPDAFVRKVLVGFGRAKAFGCGLMLLSRARADYDDA